ncbi:Uncharacterized membrane protein YgdD, TMEM256/DUF423 family [Maribacter ulvicola]|uniref:Uncharacterized membrane protein YgdD, TMEM256/DUF423 family n=2 Tax=Maribacter ulvicola TaxID=228959 RepID=A0A1N6NRU8_9FLAO|nr:Uncharacterized membrane protein YgdD, TMEM256/DUF423 family [Maribacter ulvicola]
MGNDLLRYQIVTFIKKLIVKVMKKTILSTACLFGMLAVLFGAFGAHGLKNLVDAQAVATFETGVRYQIYHAFFLFALGLLPYEYVKSKKTIYICTVLGVVLFSFSIYLLSLNSLVAFDFKVIGIVTPIGGLFLIVAWALMGYGILKSKFIN